MDQGVLNTIYVAKDAPDKVNTPVHELFHYTSGAAEGTGYINNRGFSIDSKVNGSNNLYFGVKDGKPILVSPRGTEWQNFIIDHNNKLLPDEIPDVEYAFSDPKYLEKYY